MRKRNIAAALSTLFVTGLAGALITAAPAQAATTCISPQACLTYNSGGLGAHFRQSGGITNYAGYYFEAATSGGSAGAGVSVKNHAAHVENLNQTYRFRVYYNSNYSGAYQTIPVDTSANLNSQLKNQNASGAFIL